LKNKIINKKGGVFKNTAFLNALLFIV